MVLATVGYLALAQPTMKACRRYANGFTGRPSIIAIGD